MLILVFYPHQSVQLILLVNLKKMQIASVNKIYIHIKILQKLFHKRLKQTSRKLPNLKTTLFVFKIL